MDEALLASQSHAHNLSGRALRDIGYGSAAGMISKVFEHPFDLVKVRLQSQPHDRPARFRGPVDCFRQTVSKEGFLALYRGLSMPVSGAMAENATLFVVYNQTQALVRRWQAASPDAPLHMSGLAVSAAAAGAAASFILTPVELVKCRMQVQLMVAPGQVAGAAAVPPAGPVALALDTVRSRGLTGLWMGHTGTLLREAGGSMLWFLTFEGLTRHLTPSGGSKSDVPAWQLAASGASAGIAFTVGLYPADCIKSTIQTHDELHPGSDRRGFVRVGLDIYRSQGIYGLYRGCGVTCVRSAPSSAMIFAIYSLLERKVRCPVLLKRIICNLPCHSLGENDRTPGHRHLRHYRWTQEIPNVHGVLQETTHRKSRCNDHKPEILALASSLSGQPRLFASRILQMTDPFEQGIAQKRCMDPLAGCNVPSTTPIPKQSNHFNFSPVTVYTHIRILHCMAEQVNASLDFTSYNRDLGRPFKKLHACQLDADHILVVCGRDQRHMDPLIGLLDLLLLMMQEQEKTFKVDFLLLHSPFVFGRPRDLHDLRESPTPSEKACTAAEKRLLDGIKKRFATCRGTKQHLEFTTDAAKLCEGYKTKGTAPATSIIEYSVRSCWHQLQDVRWNPKTTSFKQILFFPSSAVYWNFLCFERIMRNYKYDIVINTQHEVEPVHLAEMIKNQSGKVWALGILLYSDPEAVKAYVSRPDDEAHNIKTIVVPQTGRLGTSLSQDRLDDLVHAICHVSPPNRTVRYSVAWHEAADEYARQSPTERNASTFRRLDGLLREAERGRMWSHPVIPMYYDNQFAALYASSVTGMLSQGDWCSIGHAIKAGKPFQVFRPTDLEMTIHAHNLFIEPRLWAKAAPVASSRPQASILGDFENEIDTLGTEIRKLRQDVILSAEHEKNPVVQARRAFFKQVILRQH